MEGKTKEKQVGVSFLGLLTVLFVGLKLTGVINWSWLWVTGSLWIPFIVSLTILTVVGIVVYIKKHIKNRN